MAGRGEPDSRARGRDEQWAAQSLCAEWTGRDVAAHLIGPFCISVPRFLAGARATDLDWSAGKGPEVTGAGEALAPAMTGRVVALADRSGDGVAVLGGRPA